MRELAFISFSIICVLCLVGVARVLCYSRILGVRLTNGIDLEGFPNAFNSNAKL